MKLWKHYGSKLKVDKLFTLLISGFATHLSEVLTVEEGKRHFKTVKCLFFYLVLSEP